MRGAVWDLWSSLGMDRVDRLLEGTRKELGWLGRSVDFSGAPGFLQLASRKRVPGAPGGSCAEATWNLQISQANKLKKNVFHLFFFMFLPLPKFKLLNLLRFHLYTCKTTLFLVFAVVQWVVLFLCVTMDSPLMVFLTFLPMYNLQSHTAWHASRGKCRKGAEQQQPGCKLQLDSLPVSTGCGILCCSKYGQFPSHFRQEGAKKGLNLAFSGPCFLLNLLFFQRTRAQIPVYFGAWGQGHLDIVELAKCFLELSDFQAGCRKTVTFFVARLNPTIQDMKTHENSSLYFFFPLGPIICDFELRISALRHKSRYTVACWSFSSSEDLARIADILIGL